MKKLLLCASVMCGLVGFAGADSRNTPTGRAEALATADYGGVDITTISFSSANYLLAAGDIVIHGFHIASHTASTDFVIFRATISISSHPNAGAEADFNTNKEVFRVYLSTRVLEYGGAFVNSNTTDSISIDSKLGFDYWFKYPMRIKGGAAVKLNTSLIRLMTVFYTKFD